MPRISRIRVFLIASQLPGKLRLGKPRPSSSYLPIVSLAHLGRGELGGSRESRFKQLLVFLIK